MKSQLGSAYFLSCTKSNERKVPFNWALPDIYERLFTVSFKEREAPVLNREKLK